MSLGRALAAVVIVAAAIGGYLYLEREAARQDVQEIEGRLALAEGDLKALQVEEAKKAEELAVAQEAPSRSGGTQLSVSRADALDLTDNLIAHAAKLGLGLGNFETSQVVFSAGELELPAIAYALVSQGEPGALIDMLAIIAEVPTANVERLQLTRVPTEPDRWVMALDLVVVYEEEGQP